MERIILKADLILHGRELDSMEKGSIVIENGRILDILPQHALADFPITDACELSFPGQTLMPGMIECHNHLCIDATLPEHLELLASRSLGVILAWHAGFEPATNRLEGGCSVQLS